MKPDGKSSSTTIRATTPEQTVGQLKRVQQSLWAIMGLKAGLDRLKGLGYDVVAHCEPDGRATIAIQLRVHFDFDSGTLGGKDIMTSIDALKVQIDQLEGKSEKT